MDMLDSEDDRKWDEYAYKVGVSLVLFFLFAPADHTNGRRDDVSPHPFVYSLDLSTP